MRRNALGGKPVRKSPKEDPMRTGANGWRYTEQQNFIDNLARKLGVVAYRPNYHADTRDANTVMLYLPEDAKHNAEVDRQPTRYTRSEAHDWMKRSGVYIEEKYVWRDSFFDFANTDVNGHFNYDFANFGRLDLRGMKWKEVLEGAVRLALARKLQNKHLACTGGALALREADGTYNDFNREQIEAFQMMHGSAWMGRINFHGDQNKEVVAGTRSVYEEYTGQQVYNFGCDFIIPKTDEELEQMIRRWNGGKLPLDVNHLDKMMERIEKLRGINFVWY